MDEPNKAPERKVLVSLKVSTLLLILVAIIVAVVIIKNIPNIAKSFTKDEKSSVANAEIHEEKQISSRSLEESRITEESQSTEETTEPEVIEEVEVTQETTAGMELEQPVVEENVDASTDIMQSVGEIEQPVQTTPIEAVTISKDMDLTARTGLSKEDFITLISGVKEDTSNFFEENASLIYDVCEKYSINEIFFCGLISAESGWTIASNHRRTYNYISLMSNSGSLIKFSSLEDGMESAAKILHERYLTAGGSCFNGTTLSAVKIRFCPASSSWVNLVYGRMSQILN